MKPPGLTAITLAMCALNPTGFLFVPQADASTSSVTIAFAVIMVLSYIVLWNFWHGRNWARLLVLVTSGIALLNLLSLPTATAIQRVVIVVEAVLGAYLLVWLNASPTRAYFANGRSRAA